jgi:hypothetical protein
MTDEIGPRPEGAAAHARPTAQTRVGQVGWILWLILLVATGALTMMGLRLLLGGAFGGGVNASEIAPWVTMTRILLVLSIVCCVLAVIARRWVLFPLSVAIGLVLLVMNLVRWNV